MSRHPRILRPYGVLTLLIVACCTPADGDRPPPAGEESATLGETPGETPGRRDAADGNSVADSEVAATGAGTTGVGDDQAQGTAAPAGADGGQTTRAVATPATGSGGGGSASAPACVLPAGPLPAEASLEGRAGEYRLTMVEEVDGAPVGAPDGASARTAEGSLLLFDQVDSLREFTGGAGDPVPGVTSPLYGSTDVSLEAVGAVRVGSLSSEDPAFPGVLVIESETGASPSILLRLGADANRRTLVRFDGGYTVLTVVEVGDESFSGTWSSGVRGPDSGGFFCATRSG